MSIPPLDRKSEFFLAASHQLKGPVAIIQWCLQSMLEDPNLPAPARSMVTKSLTQADAMSKLLSDMLHVFKLSENEKVTLEPVDLNRLLDEILQQYQIVAERKKTHLVVGPIEHLPNVLGSPTYLKQAVINLLDNAIKYSPSGGKVHIKAHTKGKNVEIAVTDNGIGISEADQSRLFSEFFRSDEAREVTSDGTGLGLVLTKRIVELYGGEIQVDSRVHHGSTFTIRLPFCAH